MFGKPTLSTSAVATLALLIISGCDTRKQIVAPQGDTPVDTGQASMHVRLLNHAGGNPTAIHALRPTSDGGYVAVGYFDHEPWIFKTNAQGGIEWQLTISGFGEAFGLNRLNDVQVASDGGYVAAGRLVDRAIAIKFRIDGSIEWQWSAVHGEPYSDPPDTNRRRSAEATVIAVKPGDGGYVVAGGYGRAESHDQSRPGDGNWVVELTADGRQGRFVDPFGSGTLVFDEGRIHGFNLPDVEGGIIGTLAISDLSANGFWYAGRTADGQMVIGRAQNYDLTPYVAPTVLWKRSLGPGIVHGIRLVDRDLPDGTREQHLLLVGETPDAIFTCEMQANSGAVILAKRISGGDPAARTTWVANAIQSTRDGGYVLAAATERAPAVLKLDREGSIEWQYEYVPPATGHGSERGQALAIELRADGGYRVAGHQNMLRVVFGTPTIPGFFYYEQSATVFDIDAAGAISVNEKSGWTRVATSAATATIALESFEPAGEYDSFGPDVTSSVNDPWAAFAQPSDVIVETASGASGVLPAPPVGSNDPGDSFFWGNAPGASGFILYRSEDGATFTRDTRTQDFDFDLHNSGYFRVAAFNGAGYSEYSPVIGPLGEEPPTPPQTATLTVVNVPGGGLVTSTPVGITCGTICARGFAPGTDVTLNLIEGELLRFSSWSGCNSTAGRQCTVRMDRNITVTVNYADPN